MLVTPKYDTADPFVDTASGDFRLKSASLGYGSAFPKKSYMSSELNGRDVGSLQHVDPTLTRTKHPLAKI